jgi:arabinogalactan oligomer/maltooligosaccharide transport system permease protein
MSEAEITPTAITTPRVAATVAATQRKGPQSRPKWKETWWRHVVAWIAIVVALFPVVYIAASAFSGDNTIQDAKPWPTHPTTHNFGALFHNHVVANTGAVQDVPYLHWFVNSMVIAAVTALLTTLLGAFAAYAFSRFRFKGRRMGMLALLLIQMFPQFLALVAIYLILLHTGDVFSFVGLNTKTGLVLVYLGGAMGVNTWLMKGFFDTIP